MAQSRFYSSTAQPTTLTSGVTPTGVSVVVQASTGFPTSTPFVIALDYNTAVEELCLVTAVAGLTFTVTRAFDGTTAASHNAGAGVRHTWAGVDGNDSRTHESLTTGGGVPSTVHGVTGAVVGTTDTQTLSNKTISGPTITSPTITGTVAGGASYTGISATNLAVSNSAVGNTALSVTPIASTTADSVVINAATGLTGNLFRAQVNAVDKFRVGNDGTAVTAGGLSVTGATTLGTASTPTGTTPLAVVGPTGLTVDLASFNITGLAGLAPLRIDSAGQPHLGQGFKAGGSDQFVVNNTGSVNTVGSITSGSSGQFVVDTSGRPKSSTFGSAFTESTTIVTTTSTTYTTTSTLVQVTLSVPPSGKVQVIGQSQMFINTATNALLSTLTVSGSVSGSIRAAADASALLVQGVSSQIPGTVSFIVTSANIGEVLTITWNHRVDGATAQINYRNISAVPLLG